MTDTKTDIQIDYTIYPMPMFVTFAVPDLPAAATFYHRAGFVTLAAIPGPSGEDSVIHLRRERYQDILLVPGEPVPGSTITTFLAHGEDLAEVARRLREDLPAGADISGPAETPWFTTDLRITDPHGNTIVFSQQVADDAEKAWGWSEGFSGEYKERGQVQHKHRRDT